MQNNDWYQQNLKPFNCVQSNNLTYKQFAYKQFACVL